VSASTESTAASRKIILLLASAAFASTSAFRVLDPALPQLSEEFGVTTGRAADVVTWFALAYGLMQFVYGPIGDRFGKFQTLAIATLACAFGNLFVALASSFEMVLLGRFFSGATAAAIVPLSMAWIGDHVAYENRQATLAQFMLGTIFGITAGLVIGGVFTDTVGWRGSFVFLAVLYTIVGVWLVKQRKHVPEQRSAVAGRLQLLAPIRKVLSTPWARVVLVVVLIEGALVFGGLSFVPAYLQERHGMSSTAAGLVTGFFGVGSILYVVFARWLVNRVGEAKLALAGGWTMALCYALYVLTDHWYWAIFASVLFGLGFYLLHAVLQTNATQMTPAVRGTAVSLFASFLFGGQALGVAGGALMVDKIGIGSVLGMAALALPILGIAFSMALARHIRSSA
jgi:YNFM family putative membrane transporter